MHHDFTGSLLAGTLLHRPERPGHVEDLAHFRFADVQGHSAFLHSRIAVPQKDIDSPKNGLTRSRSCRFSGNAFARIFTGFPDSSYDRLHQPVDAFSFVSVYQVEAKLRLVFGPLANPNGQLATKIVLDECGLVAASLYIPRVHPQRGEIA